MIRELGWRAVLFDLDGVIVDSERLYDLAAKDGLRALGLELDMPVLGSLVGLTYEASEAVLQRWYGSAFNPAKFKHEYSAALDRHGVGSPPLKPGAAEFVAEARSVTGKTALVTSSDRLQVETMLARLGMADAFDAIVAGNEAMKVKPDPAPYLLAAHRLNVAIAECLVLEDSAVGLESGLAAGAVTVWVRDVGAVDSGLVDRCFATVDSLSNARHILSLTR